MIEESGASTPTEAMAAYLNAQLVVPVYANGYLAGGPAEQVSVQRVGGPDSAVDLQVDVWGQFEPTTEYLAAEVAHQLDSLVGYAHNGTLLQGCSKPTTRFFPDEGGPRYILEVTVTTARE